MIMLLCVMKNQELILINSFSTEKLLGKIQAY